MDRLTIHEISTSDSPVLRLALAGELDVVNVGKLSDTAVRVLERGAQHILLDLTDVTWCDSGSLYTILGIRHAAQHAGVSLNISAAGAPVRETLHRTGLRDLLPITPL
ncbi:STAS domain-containing protein [Streptomyces sp. NPDC051776]|uniref:STAS domain-containing protein n=1 Tax=Streptomyces sp. NPDC051776 TaxID=3155414 RepID=UPI00343DCEBE